MNDPLRVAVVGATGYAGYELARLLLRHPKIDMPTFYLREGNANVRCLTELYPRLRGWGEAPCEPLSAAAIAASGADVAFLSTPHEASLELVPQLLAAVPRSKSSVAPAATVLHGSQRFVVAAPLTFSP